MIDYFSGVDTEFYTTGTLWCFAIESLQWFNFNFKKGRSSNQYFITPGMGQISMFLTFCTVYNLKNFSGGKFGLWVGWEGEEESQGPWEGGGGGISQVLPLPFMKPKNIQLLNPL